MGAEKPPLALLRIAHLFPSAIPPTRSQNGDTTTEMASERDRRPGDGRCRTRNRRDVA